MSLSGCREQSGQLCLLSGMECPGGGQYKSCGPGEDNTCASPWTQEQGEQQQQEEEEGEEEEEGLCVEGCYCPAGKVLWQGNCVTRVRTRLIFTAKGITSLLSLLVKALRLACRSPAPVFIMGGSTALAGK